MRKKPGSPAVDDDPYAWWREVSPSFAGTSGNRALYAGRYLS